MEIERTILNDIVAEGYGDDNIELCQNNMDDTNDNSTVDLTETMVDSKPQSNALDEVIYENSKMIAWNKMDMTGKETLRAAEEKLRQRRSSTRPKKKYNETFGRSRL